VEIFEKCLQACENILGNAAGVLSQVKELNVLKEVFSCTQGKEKAQGLCKHT